MVKRRTVLGLLGTSVFGAGGYVYFEGDLRGDRQANLPNEQPQRSSELLNTISKKIADTAQQTPSATPSFDFSYNPIDADIENGVLFDHIVAEAASSHKGDRIRLTPKRYDRTTSAALLRKTWGVGKKQIVETTVRGTSVTLAGGTARGHAFLVGTTAASRPEVIAARGVSLDIAKGLGKDIEVVFE